MRIIPPLATESSVWLQRRHRAPQPEAREQCNSKRNNGIEGKSQAEHLDAVLRDNGRQLLGLRGPYIPAARFPHYLCQAAPTCIDFPYSLLKVLRRVTRFMDLQGRADAAYSMISEESSTRDIYEDLISQMKHEA